MDEGDNNGRRPNFSQEESKVLVREVQARNSRIYGDENRAPRADDAKAAWEEVTVIVNQVCPDIPRTVAQCKKRYNDVRRRTKLKLFEHRVHTSRAHGTPLGKPVSKPLSSAEDIASSTVSPISIAGFGGIEVGFSDAQETMLQEDMEEEGSLWTQEEGGSWTQEESEPGTQDLGEGYRRQQKRHRVEEQDQAFIDTQQGGFRMLERELGSISSQLQGLEARLRGLEDRLLPVASIDATLQRLANAAERLLATRGTSRASLRPRWPLRARTRGRPVSSRSPRSSPADESAEPPGARGGRG